MQRHSVSDICVAVVVCIVLLTDVYQGQHASSAFSLPRQQSYRLIRERAGRSLHTKAREGLPTFGQKDKVLLSKISEAGSRRDWQLVHKLYSAYTGNEIPIFNAVMHEALDCQQYKEGTRVWRQRRKRNATRTFPTFTAALKLHARVNLTSDVRQIWAEAREACDLTDVLAAARIDAAAAERDVETAAEILDEMNRTGVNINIAHIRACWQASGSRHSAAKFIFRFSRGLDLQPNIANYSALVGACVTAPLSEVQAVLSSKELLEPDRAFAEVCLTSVLGLAKEETVTRRKLNDLLARLQLKPPTRLAAARTALQEFRQIGVEFTTLAELIACALDQLEQVGS